jgi:putative flippase GtrA
MRSTVGIAWPRSSGIVAGDEQLMNTIAAIGWHGIVRQLLNYAKAGALATATHYLVLLGLLWGDWLSPVLASTVGAIAGAGVAYIANARWTFSGMGVTNRSLPRFLCVAAMGTVLNAAVLILLYEIQSVPLLAAQLLATLLVFLATFVVNRQWSFR